MVRPRWDILFLPVLRHLQSVRQLCVGVSLCFPNLLLSDKNISEGCPAKACPMKGRAGQVRCVEIYVS
jgi:hypothetical protein